MAQTSVRAPMSTAGAAHNARSTNSARVVRRIRLALALSLAGTFGMLAAPATTLGSCAQPLPIAEALKSAEIVFVGTVVQVSEGNRWANVQVEEVWKGPDRPQNVLVRGGPAGNAATSVDRSFEVGVKYIFFPYVAVDAGEGPAGSVTDGGVPAGGVPENALTDNSCTNTTAFTDEHKALRPDDARKPIGAAPSEAAGFDPMTLVVPAGIALVVAATLLGVGLLARGRETT